MALIRLRCSSTLTRVCTCFDLRELPLFQADRIAVARAATHCTALVTVATITSCFMTYLYSILEHAHQHDQAASIQHGSDCWLTPFRTLVGTIYMLPFSENVRSRLKNNHSLYFSLLYCPVCFSRALPTSPL